MPHPPPLRLNPTRAALLVAAAGTVAMTAPALALEENPGEKEQLTACEARLCGMILARDDKGEDLKCRLEKTWAKKTLEGGKSKKVSWGFGDARCSLDFALDGDHIESALTKPEHTIQVPRHTVNCVVEQGGVPEKVMAKLAPKIVFKNGEANKIWINLEELEGPENVKGTVWMAATLEDKLGIFHGSMLKSVNKFIGKRCPKKYGAKPAVAKVKAKENKEKKKANVQPAGTAAAASREAPAETAAAPPAAPPSASPATAENDAIPPKQPQDDARAGNETSGAERARSQ